MRSAARLFHSPVAHLTFVLAAFAIAVVPAQGDVAGSEDKLGFLKRLNPFAKKEEPPPPAPPPPPPPVEKPKSPTPGPKPRVVTKSTASKGSAKKSTATSTPAKKAPAKPAAPPVVVKKEDAPVKPAAKPVPAPAPAPVVTAKTDAPAKIVVTPAKKDGEFGHGDDDDSPVAPSKPAATSAAPTPATPLSAASKNGGWQIVKINGRDYVTGESIHQFYRFSSYKVDGKHVWLRSNNLILKAQIGSLEMLINNIKFILSYPVMEADGRALFSRLDLCKLIDPVLRPTYITDAMPFDTIVLDAGHGGHDVGARGVYGYEKDFALKMAFAVRDALTRRGFKVVMTRSTDKFITLSDRVAIANSIANSIFVSVHFNSSEGETASGIETFALTPQGSSASLVRGGGFNAYGLTGNSHDSANIALATAVHAMVISKFKFVDRGIKRAQWSVLTGCKRPGILFEGGFVTNGAECRLIASDTYRQSVSVAIAEAIGNYRTALRGAMTNRR